ncbi:MAG TPA: hypothetical protein VGV14_00275 [Rhodanobacter sp.]|nr:hypothetical protein [Rhodanobacter sp.]
MNPEDVYDPDIVGDGPTASISGIGYRNAAGVLLKFAALSYGTAAPNHGYRLSDGRDFSALWAKKGTAVYTLPINGKAYTENSQTRGQAYVQFNILADGTWNVTTWNSGRSPTTRVDDSGTWLPSGDSASNWSVQMTNSGSGSVVAHLSFTGVNTQTTTAPAPTALSSGQSAQQTSQATTTGTNATWNGDIIIKLYRLGVLRSTTDIHTSLNCNGN